MSMHGVNCKRLGSSSGTCLHPIAPGRQHGPAMCPVWVYEARGEAHRDARLAAPVCIVREPLVSPKS